MGFNAIKYDVDQANDPNKYDPSTGQQVPVNYKEWYDQIAAAREAVGPKIDICV